MSLVRGRITTGKLATGTAALTLLQLTAPANQGVALEGFRISFDGVTATDPPIVVEILRQTTAGTFTNTLTAVKVASYGSEAVQAVVKSLATVEPTAGDILEQFQLQPYYGNWREYFRFDKPIPVPGGGRLGLRVTATVSRMAIAQYDWEE